MYSPVSKICAFVVLTYCGAFAASAAKADKNEEAAASAELQRIHQNLENLSRQNHKLEAELETLRQQGKQATKERIFVDVRAGGNLGLSNLAGSGYGYATGLEFVLGSGFSAYFRFASGLLSISAGDFNGRLAGEGVSVSGTSSLSSMFFGFGSGVCYEILAWEGFSIGVGAGVVVKKLAGSLFEAPAYTAAAGDVYAWYRIFGGVDAGIAARFEYGNISQISVSGANVLFNKSQSANEISVMLALRFAVL